MNDHENPIPPDEERPPHLIPGRGGTRMYSLAALVERIVSAFEQEHGDDLGAPSPALLEAQTPADKRKLLRDIVSYVLAVESIHISAEDQADLLRTAYSEIFGYGPLDALFADESVTTIALEGSEKVSVRRGHGELTTSDLLFEDLAHFRRIIARLLRHAGAELRDDQPIIETGLIVDGRPISINLVGPPVTIQLTADIRVHRRELPALAEIAGIHKTAALLEAIAQSPHGFVIVGEPESGKTTLLAALLQLARQEKLVTVERAGELRLPESAEQLIVRWPVGETPGLTFGDQVSAALAQSPDCIVLDEVRADETAYIAPLLLPEDAASTLPRLIWVFRGPAESTRLISALGMVARRSDPGRSELLVRALYERLPFVITMRRRKDALHVYGIAEWQFSAGADHPDYVELMTMGWEGLEMTGKRPSHPLDLPDEFWT